MKIFGREPALWIGTIVSIIIAVVRILAGDAIIGPDQADAISNIATKIGDLAFLLLPLITAVLIRPSVTSIAEPKLPLWTAVIADYKQGPDDQPPPDAAVLPVEDRRGVLPQQE